MEPEGGISEEADRELICKGCKWGRAGEIAVREGGGGGGVPWQARSGGLWHCLREQRGGTLSSEHMDTGEKQAGELGSECESHLQV